MRMMGDHTPHHTLHCPLFAINRQNLLKIIENHVSEKMWGVGDTASSLLK